MGITFNIKSPEKILQKSGVSHTYTTKLNKNNKDTTTIPHLKKIKKTKTFSNKTNRLENIYYAQIMRSDNLFSQLKNITIFAGNKKIRNTNFNPAFQKKKLNISHTTKTLKHIANMLKKR